MCRRTLLASLPVIVFVPMLLLEPVGANEVNTIVWEPYTYTTRSGDTVSDCELGRLVVPERHAAASGTSIELAFVRFRSTAASPAAPIVWLAGGPSDYGSDDIEGPYLALVREMQRVADVVALDQRGTGLSRPLLDCPESHADLPLDRPYDARAALVEYLRLSRECAEHFEAAGIDLAAYNTVENAHDVEALRRALGVPKINLYGASYGTHLAFAVLRYHPDAIDRLVLSGIEGPDHTWKLPSNIDRFFAKVFETARNDDAVSTHYADVEVMLRAVLERLEKQTVTVELEDNGGAAEVITLGKLDLQLGLRAFLGSRDNISRLPLLLQQLYDGEYETVARYLRRSRRVTVSSAMYYCMDCASGATPERQRQIEMEATSSLSGAVNFPFPAICKAWPHARVDDAFRAPLHSEHPTLFVSGTLDGQTPPSNAREVAAGFAAATHVVVDGGSHQYLELHPPELPQRLAAFFRGDRVADTTFVVPLEFVLPETRKSAATR